MGVLELGRKLNLTPETVHVHPSPHLGREEFDHHLPAEVHLLREIDARHPAATQLSLDTIRVADGGLEAVQEVSHGG